MSRGMSDFSIGGTPERISSPSIHFARRRHLATLLAIAAADGGFLSTAQFTLAIASFPSYDSDLSR